MDKVALHVVIFRQMITYRQTVLTELGSIPKSAGNVFPKTSDGLIKKTSAWAGALV